jgi:hypothetical protein
VGFCSEIENSNLVGHHDRVLSILILHSFSLVWHRSVAAHATPAALYCDAGSFAAVTTRSVSLCRDSSGAAIRPGARFIQIKTKCFSGTKQDE